MGPLKFGVRLLSTGMGTFMPGMGPHRLKRAFKPTLSHQACDEPSKSWNGPLSRLICALSALRWAASDLKIVPGVGFPKPTFLFFNFFFVGGFQCL